MTNRLIDDYHVHSTFSDDATSTVAENLAAARKLGLRTVCLSDHVRSDTGWLGEYVDEVRRGGRPGRPRRGGGGGGEAPRPSGRGRPPAGGARPGRGGGNRPPHPRPPGPGGTGEGE